MSVPINKFANCKLYRLTCNTTHKKYIGHTYLEI